MRCDRTGELLLDDDVEPVPVAAGLEVPASRRDSRRDDPRDEQGTA